MQPISFPGAVEIKKPVDMTDEECMSIWAQTGEQNGYPYYMTCWKPSYEDMQALQRGEGIFIMTIARALPPMAVFTRDENGNANDAG